MNRTIGMFAAIALFVSPAFAQTPTPVGSDPAAHSAATPETLILAKALLEADGTYAKLNEYFGTLEDKFSSIIVLNLRVGGEGDAAKIKAAVHAAFAPVLPGLAEAKTQAVAANFSSQELQEALSYAKSSTAQAVVAKNALLRSAYSEALGFAPQDSKAQSGPAAAPFFQAPQATRDLVHRILLAQDIEGKSRKSLAMLGAVMATAPKYRTPAPRPLSDAEQRKQGDAYVRQLVGVYERFYAANFTQAQLAEIAAYSESSVFKAMMDRSPAIGRAVHQIFQNRLAMALTSLARGVCDAVACGPPQRADLAAFIDSVRAQIPAIIKAVG